MTSDQRPCAYIDGPLECIPVMPAMSNTGSRLSQVVPAQKVPEVHVLSSVTPCALRPTDLPNYYSQLPHNACPFALHWQPNHHPNRVCLIENIGY